MSGRKTARYQIRQTIVTVVADEPYHAACLEAIKRSRAELEQFIARDPYFRATFEPYGCPAGAPPIVERMCAAAARAGVGPMAAVAGAIAESAVEAMARAGARHALVDNGGDIALLNEETALVGIYAGASPFRDLALEVPPRDRILGICTSSGTVGPSISLGNADAALIVSDDVALADAAATALGNRIADGSSLATAFDFLRAIPEIGGAIGIVGGRMATYGQLPKIVRAKVDYDLITKGEP